MRARWLPGGVAVAVLLASTGCERPSPVDGPAVVRDDVLATPSEGGAVSTAPVVAEPELEAPAASEPVAPATTVDWGPLSLDGRGVTVSCELDYQQQGDGEAIAGGTHEELRSLLAPCAERGVVRLRYDGRIDAAFAAVVERIATLADEEGIGNRVLDLNSAGGQIEEAIRSGDFIGGSGWTIWVREGSVCHSACVLTLAGGDVRVITGQVGIHRIIRMSSTATTRAQLNEELNVVYRRVREYLERNGAAVAVADLMMAVPNRSLRIMSSAELQLYGLDGVNAAQDDLVRLKLMRVCGEDFVRRRDAFLRAFDRRCKASGSQLEDVNGCGVGLRGEFGFPDSTCPAESPFSEFDAKSAALAESPAEESAGAASHAAAPSAP